MWSLSRVDIAFTVNNNGHGHGHGHGHSLDLMICSLGCTVLSVSASDLISDHFSVVANLQIPSNHSRAIPQTIKYRKLQSINMEAFKADILNSDLIRYPKTELAQQYDSFLHTFINLHAPLVSKTVSLKPPNPWMTPAILASNDIVDILSAFGVEMRPH